MKHVYWHDKLVSPSLHHPLTFGFFGNITWQAFLDMQPPAGPSHTALSKTVHSDIGHRRKWRLCALRASVRVCVSCLKQWMAALSVGEQLCMLFVFTLGKCTLSPSSGEQREFAITAPHVYFCAHLSQSKAGDQIKLLTHEEFCQPHNAAAA